MSRPPLSRDELNEQAGRLLAAAFDLVGETGDLDPPVRDILRRAGLSRQALYRCYSSKDALMAAALVEGTKILADYLTARVRQASDPPAMIRAWIRGVMRQAEAPHAAARTRPFVLAHPARLHHGVDPLETTRLLTASLVDAISIGVEGGHWTTVDPVADALVIHDFVFASMRRHLVADERPTRAATQRLGDFALYGLAMHIEATARR